MKTICLFLPVFFLFSISMNAQKTNTSTQKKPASIYTVSNILNANNNFTTLNKKLNLNNFNFVYLNQLDLDVNPYSILLTDFGKTPTALIYDDYKSYRDENLLKGFLREHDPTRWNLWCPSPLSVQPTK